MTPKLSLNEFPKLIKIDLTKIQDDLKSITSNTIITGGAGIRSADEATDSSSEKEIKP